MNQTLLSHRPDDPGIRLLGLQISAKRTEQAARRSLGESLTGPVVLVPYFVRTWQVAKYAEQNVHRELKRNTRRTVLQFIPKAAAR